MEANLRERKGELLMTNNAEEETKPPELVALLRLDGSVGKTLEYQSKGRGFKSHSSQFSDFEYWPMPWRNIYLDFEI